MLLVTEKIDQSSHCSIKFDLEKGVQMVCNKFEMQKYWRIKA